MVAGIAVALIQTLDKIMKRVLFGLILIYLTLQKALIK
jgi:hypothetical protein